MWKFHLKLKHASKMLSKWSRYLVGNIFDKIKLLENKVATLENNSILDNSTSNRTTLNQANAELILAYKKEEAFWK